MTASPSVLPLQLGGGATYQISRSVRLRSSASAYFNRTPSVTGSQTTFTYSAWIKRGLLSSSATYNLLGNSTTTTGEVLDFNTDGLRWSTYTTGSLKTTQVFRDPSSWYHIVFVLDTTNATSSSRLRMYVNGVQVTSFITASYPAQNAATQRTNVATATNYLGSDQLGTASFFDGYLAEVNFIDGQALTSSSFGYTDSNGIWQPKSYTGTYGTNGFYLKFTDNSAATAAAIGKDYSGNGNNWTPNNISVTAGTTYDSMIDSPTVGAGASNYAVLNPLDKSTSITVTDGNLNATTSSPANYCIVGSMGVPSGKWYWEATITAQPANGQIIGITKGISNYNVYLGADANSYAYGYSGQKSNSGSFTAYGATYTTNDVIGVALDLSAGTLVFYKNNVSQGTAFTGLSGTFFPAASTTNGCSFTMNFGQQGFKYTPPSGFAALNTYNLPAATINNGATVMAASTYTGNGTYPTTITNGGNNTAGTTFKPDLVWIKARSIAYSNILYDSVRGTGTTKSLSSDQTSAEPAFSTNANLSAFAANGFTVDATSSTNILNASGQTFVGWQWQAGQGTTSSNTNGSITSTVSVNQSAGFSVVTYTSTGANATVGHGLGVAPSMIIVKNRASGTTNWPVYHKSLTAAGEVFLNATNAYAADATMWQSTAPTSTVFSVGSNANLSAGATVAYCWAEVAGYSKFGSYTGNASADGPFVYLGFRPRFVMIKNASDGTATWIMWDSSRDTYNVERYQLYPNQSAAEVTDATNNTLDFLSNGFKYRGASSVGNGSGNTIIYAAFAENPFNISRAR